MSTDKPSAKKPAAKAAAPKKTAAAPAPKKAAAKAAPASAPPAASAAPAKKAAAKPPAPAPIPPGYPGAVPYLIAKDPEAFIAFLEKGLGGKERMRLSGPGGSIMHAEVQLGEGVVMLSGEWPDRGTFAPDRSKPSMTMTLCLYVTDVDAVTAQAKKAGAKILLDPKDEFYGDRVSRILDPVGYVWSLMQHVEDVSPAEMNRRMAAMMQGG